MNQTRKVAFSLFFAVALLVQFPAASFADPITAIVGAIVSAAKTFAAIEIGSTTIGGILKGIAASASVASFASSLLFKPKKQATSNTINKIGGLKQTVRDPLQHYRIVYGRARVGSVWVWFNTNGPNNEFFHVYCVLANHPIEQIEQVYFGNEKVYDANDSTFALDANGFVLNDQYYNADTNQRLARLRFHTGEYDQTADTTAIAENPGVITENHRLQGHAYIYVRLQYVQENFPNGIPEITAVIRGKNDIYDPRTGNTGYTNNTALCVRDFLVGKFQDGARYGFGTSSSEIDDAKIVAAANACDEQVELKNGGMQSRYSCNGVIETDQNKLDVLSELLDTGAAVCPFVQGVFKLSVGEYSPPVITIDEDWFAGGINVQTNPPKSELANTITGVFVDPGKDWEATDFPEVTNSLYRSQDGEVLNKEVQLSFVNDSERAQRLAKIALETARQGIIVEGTFNLRAMQLCPYDLVNLNFALFGFENKPFRVLEWSLNEDATINLKLQEQSPTGYDWDRGSAVLKDPAPNTTLPNPSIVQPPGNLQVSEEKFVNITSNGVQSKAVLTWTPSQDAFVNQYSIKYRLLPSGEFVPGGTISATRGITQENAEIRDLDPGLYEFRVVAINTLGGRSNPAIRQVEIFGLTDPPADITGLSLNVIDRNAHLKWAAVNDLDVIIGGRIEIRHSPDSAANWENAIKIGPALAGKDTNTTLPLLAGTYLIKAVDAGGNYSTNAASVNAAVANAFNFNVVATQAEAPTFSGTKTGMSVDSSTLIMSGTTFFDAATGLFDAKAGLFDDGGGGAGGLHETQGTYEFSDYVDLGDTYTSRVYVDIRFSPASSSSDTFDSAAGLFDVRSGLFDGGTEDISSLSVIPYIRTTNDDPAGSPTWSTWREFYVGDYTARAFEFKVEVDTGDSSRNIAISTLTASVDVPERTETFIDESIVIAGTTLTYSKPFFAKPRLGGIIHTPSGNMYLELVHVTSGSLYTGVTVKIDQGGAYKDGTADVYATGY